MQRRQMRLVTLVPALLVAMIALIAPSARADISASARASERRERPASSPLGSTDRRDTRPSSAAFDELETTAREHGRVLTIVGLRTLFTPEGLLTRQQATAQRAEIADERSAMLADLAGTPHRVMRTFDVLPYVSLRLTPASIEALRGSEHVATIDEDIPAAPTLAESTKIIEATETKAVGRTGAGQAIAILDMGVDKTHPFLQKQVGGPSKVVSEACYTVTSDCPNGLAKQTGAGAGVPCDVPKHDGQPSPCDHGTHVAGIAAGNRAAAGVNFDGVAPKANIIAIRVFHEVTSAEECAAAGALAPCALASTTDVISGLNRVYNLRDSFSIASVNLSLGSSPTGSGYCDSDPRKGAIDLLLSVNIATVVSSGNEGSTTGVGAPGCISTAITVGSTTDLDTVSTFSNSSSVVDLLAPGGADDDADDPGTDILSSVPAGMDDDGTPDGFEEKQGTSMAAPHVAGAFAVMKSVDPATYSVYTAEYYLKITGKPITDPFNGVTVPRIRLLSATVRIKETGFKTFQTFTYAGGGVVSSGVGLARRAGEPRVNGISLTLPTNAVVQNAYLYYMTIGGPDERLVFVGADGCPAESCRRKGLLVGASDDPGTNINQGEATRVYRVNLPNSVIAPGSATYQIAGVGDRGNGVDGQGASLVVVYSQPITQTGTVVIREGSMTATYNETISQSFTGLSVPSSPTSVRLHVGVGDGQSGQQEDPMLFAGTPVTDPNDFFGADGSFWDAPTLTVPTSSLPAGTGSRSTSLHVIDDNLAWGYAILTYRYA